MLGTTSHLLRTHLKQVTDQMDECAHPRTVHTTGRRSELAEAVAALPEIRAAAPRLGWPTNAEKAVACGIGERLAEFRADNCQRTIMGRVAYNSTMDAALCAIEEHIQSTDKSGDLAEVARLLGISDRSLYDLRQRSNALDLRTLLDPSKETRSDA